MTPVEQAARILDRKTPGWANKIDLELLDLTSALFCVLGQVYGNYFEASSYHVQTSLLEASVPQTVFCDNVYRSDWLRAIAARTEQVFVPAEWEKETVPA